MNPNNPIIICFFLIALLACNSNQQEKSASEPEVVENVDSATFLKLITEGDGLLIDVRTEEEISQGVIGEPIKIDFSDEDFYRKLEQLPKDKDIYIYCAVGGRSGKAAEYLKDKGYAKIYNLKGGMRNGSK